MRWKMSRLCAFAVSIWIFSLLAIEAQSTQDNPQPSYELSNGFHLVGGSISAGYSSSLGSLGSTWNPAVNSPLFYEWASVTAGYTHAGPLGTLSIYYTPSFSGASGMGSLNSFNQHLALGFSRQFSPKFGIHFTGEASDLTLQTFLFGENPSDSLSNPAGVPAGAANPQTLLFGARELLVAARAGFEYRPTTRLRVSLEGGMDQIQALTDTSGQLAAVIPRARTEHANIGFDYDLTTRTELQTHVASTDAQSPLVNYVITTITEGFVRKLTRHWYVSLQAGGGFYESHSPGGNSPLFTSYVAGGGFGYRGRANTFGASYNRAIGDSFGVGSGSTDSLQGSWNWHRPGSSWGLHASAVQQRLIGGYLGNFSLWQAGGGVTHALGRRTYVGFEYGYLYDTAIPPGFVGRPQAHALRLTFGWNALGLDRPRLSVPMPGAAPSD